MLVSSKVCGFMVATHSGEMHRKRLYFPFQECLVTKKHSVYLQRKTDARNGGEEGGEGSHAHRV